MHRRRIILTAFLLGLSPDMYAEETDIALPAGIVLPWHAVGIVPERHRLAQKTLDQLKTQLDNAALQSPQNVSATLKNPTTLNLQTALKGFTSGELKPGIAAKNVVLQPIWCSSGSQDLIFLTVSDLQTHRLLAAQEQVLPRAEWDQLLTTKNLEANLAPMLDKMIAKVQASLQSSATDNALHVGIDLARETTRADVGSSHCLNLLLASRLVRQNYQVVNPIAGEAWGTLRRAYHLTEAAVLRPTRRLVTDWQRTRKSSGEEQLALNIRTAESVLGQQLPTLPKSEQLIAISSDREMNFAIDDNLRGFLQGEKEALALNETPQISKIEGAWVYLDKGRAYGLQMDDRLVLQQNGQTDQLVKGHVVGFFGPELGIKSPRGRTINEGAIVFVRKGQVETKLGQTLTFDPQTYPANP